MKKREYEARMAQLQESYETVEIMEAEIKRLYEINTEAAMAGLRHLGLEGFEGWNELHDAIDALRDEMHALNMEWARKDWTYNDYQTAELVAQNID